MKTAAHKYFRQAWRLLTEVPGWPNAPLGVRIRRALPIVVPCTGLLLLAGWKVTVLEPRIQADEFAHQPVQALLDEIAALRQDCSDQQAEEVAAQAGLAAHLALTGPEEMTAVLSSLRRQAAERGWDAVFNSSESTDEPPAPGARLAFMQARGRLTPATLSNGSFASLLALLEQFSAAGKRIDLTRLAIRADEHGRHAVEVNLRLARLVTHEKAAQ